MAQVKITARNNGPFRVEAPEGSVELVDADGNKFDITGKPAFSLCRCGGSINKPFCDGTHSKIGFAKVGGTRGETCVGASDPSSASAFSPPV
jgi:CDGSH-type Zn-finger protein